MHRLGILDLGSNTARLVVYNMERGRWFRLMGQIREPVRLGEGLGATGRLADAAMERTEAAVALFVDYAGNMDIQQLAVLGTSALRDADNGPAFLSRIESLGLEVQVLEGEEEARRGVLAVSNSFDLQDAWVVDLGGGSAQLSRMAARRFATGQAHPLGAVRLTEAYLLSDPPTSDEIRSLEAHVERHLSDQAAEIAADDAPLVVMGGTIRNLARVAQKREQYPLSDRLHGYFLRAEMLEELTEELAGRSVVERQLVPGIRADRADIVVAGALVFRWLLRRSGREGLWISGYGLREGELFRHFLEPPHLLKDIRSFSVANLLAHYARADRSTATVKHLAVQLLAGLVSLHGLGEREADLLHVAADLQDLGLAVSYYRQGRHAEYLVSAAQLNGFSHREQALIARMVRFHSKGEPTLGPLANCCESADARVLEVLVSCLRLAERLDRPRGSRVRDLEVILTEDAVKVRLFADEGAVIEQRQVGSASQLLERIFGRSFTFARAS